MLCGMNQSNVNIQSPIVSFVITYFGLSMTATYTHTHIHTGVNGVLSTLEQADDAPGLFVTRRDYKVDYGQM